MGESDYPAGVYDQIRGSCAGNRMYLGRGGGDYQEVSEQFGINSVGWAYSPSFSDFDGDGYVDIYAATGFMSFDRHKPDG